MEATELFMANQKRYFIQTLAFKNYRCFPELLVHFDEQLTVFVAPNGGGKTAVLDGIAIGLRPFVDTMEGSQNVKGLEAKDIRMIPSLNNRMEAVTPVQLVAQGVFFGTPLAWERERLSQKAVGKKNRTTQDLVQFALDLIEKNQAWVQRKSSVAPLYPLIAYYGTGRIWSSSNSKQTPIIAPNARDRGYSDCLSAVAPYKTFIDWFRRFSYEAKKEPTEATSPHQPEHPLHVVRAAVDRALTPSGWHHLEWDFVEDTIVAHHPTYGRLPVDTLSDGIRTMIGLVADIAYRATLLNPQLYARAAIETPGIVLIDEIDRHLHPEWQQVVLSLLQQAFPLIQFMVTTHSPQVLTTLRKDQIRILACDTAGQWTAHEPTISPLAHESGDALAFIMHTHPRPDIPNILSDMHAYEQLARAGHGDSVEAQHIKTRLDRVGFAFSAADQALFDFFARKAANRKANNK